MTEFLTLPVWTGVAAIVSCAALVAFLLQDIINTYRKNIDDQLHHAADRKQIKEKLRADSIFENYQSGIERFNSRVESWMGPVFSLPSAMICLQLAIIYPILLFVAGWSFGGDGLLSEHKILSDQIGSTVRLSVFTLILSATFVFLYAFNCIYHREGYPFLIINRYFSHESVSVHSYLVTMSLGGASGAIGGALAGAISDIGSLPFASPAQGVSIIAVGASGAFIGSATGFLISFWQNRKLARNPLYGILLGALLGAATVLIANSIASKTQGIVAGACAIFGAGCVTIVSFNRYPFVGSFAVLGTIVGVFVAGSIILTDRWLLALIIVFFVALPISNAFADWISWMVTRLLMMHVPNIRSGAIGMVILFFELLFDLVAAIACLILLAAAIPNLIELFNFLGKYVDYPVIDWRAMLLSAQNEPLSNGLMVTGMLITTLIPTSVHFGSGLAGLITVLSPPGRNIIKIIPNDASVKLSPRQRQEIIRLMLWKKICFFPSFALSFLLVAFFAYVVLSYSEPASVFLGHVARCATMWTDGSCPLAEL